jgi:hypothetical protein
MANDCDYGEIFISRKLLWWIFWPVVQVDPKFGLQLYFGDRQDRGVAQQISAATGRFKPH